MLALALGAESLLVNQGLKRLFRRPRPTAEGDPRYPVRRPLTSSFPSGPRQRGRLHRRAADHVGRQAVGPAVVGPRRVVGVSRAYVRIHHASDVVAGMAAGAVLGLGARAILRRTGILAGRRYVASAMTRPFGLTYDYRCPFARIVHEHVVTGLRAGADWDVTWLPFSLGQAHVAEGEPSVWERPEHDTGLLALQVSIAVRDTQPDRFLDAHHALFEHRHAAAGAIDGRDDLTPVLEAAGVDVAAVWAEVDSGRPLATVEKEHTAFVESHNGVGRADVHRRRPGRVRPPARAARRTTPPRRPRRSSASSTRSAGRR